MMVTVFFPAELQRITGEEKIDISVSSYRELISELVCLYDLKSDELMKMAVALDGLIIHDPLLEKFDDGSEVHFLHRISGG